MSRKLIAYLIEIMKCICQMLVFTDVIFLIGFGFFKTETTSVFICLYISVVIIGIMYLMRRFLKNKILYVAVCMLLSGSVLFMGQSVEEKLAYVIVAVAEFAYSMVVAANNKDGLAENIPVGFLALFVISSLIGGYVNSDLIYNSSVYMAFAFIIMKLIDHHLCNEDDFFSVNVDTSNVPYHQMIKVNTFIMLIVTVVCSAIMFILNNNATVNMAKGLLKVVGFVFGKIFALIFAHGESVPEENMITTPPETGGGMGAMPPVPEETIVTAILNWIAIVVGVVVCVTLFVAICVAVVKKVKGIHIGGGVETDEREFIAPSNLVATRVKRNENKDETEKLPANLKVRKLYKNTVLKNFGKSGRYKLDKMAPETITASYVGEDTNATRIYEKARYSKNTISDDEIQYMQRLKKRK